jgi:uncharacterized protein YcfL
MKKIVILSFISFLLAGCSKGFLDSVPLTKKTNVTFYQSAKDADEA